MTKQPKHPPTTSHNYEKKILAAGLTTPRGSASTFDVLHDDWCDIYRGGFCNCDPEIRMRDGLHGPIKER
jgi:hypothetical protein